MVTPSILLFVLGVLGAADIILFHTYLAIIFLFNELLLPRGDAPGSGWMARALADERLAPANGTGLARITDAAGEPVRVLRLRLFSVPLPFLR